MLRDLSAAQDISAIGLLFEKDKGLKGRCHTPAHDLLQLSMAMCTTRTNTRTQAQKDKHSQQVVTTSDASISR